MSSSRLPRRLLAALSIVAASVPLVIVAPSGAAETNAADATLDWAVSDYVGTSSSLTPERVAGSPATVDASGWHLTGGTGTYDPSAGDVSLSFDGTIEFGNVFQGNYGFLLSDVGIEIDDGAGRLVADVATRGPGAPPLKTTFASPVQDVTVVTFDALSGAEDDGTVTWTVTPHTEDVATSPEFDGAQQFPQSFLDAFSPALHAHFQQTSADGAGAPANTAKVPAPLSFGLAFDAAEEPETPEEPDEPTVTVTPRSDLDPAGATVQINGSGFGDATDGVYVRLCAAADGTIGTAAGRSNADRCLDEPQLWVSNVPGASAPMGADGSFSVQLEVVGSFTGGDGDAFDCHDVRCGIATRRDHIGGATDFSLDTFTSLTFADGETAPTDPEPTDPEPTDPTDPEPTDPTPEPTEPAGPGATPGTGTLDWGVKASFRNYVERGPAAGAVTTTAPATRNDDGTFRFVDAGGGTYDTDDDVHAPFEGTVRFTGHEGALDLVIDEPRITVTGDTGTLMVDAESKGLDSAETESFDDVQLAALDLSDVQPTADGLDVTFADVPAVLTEDGAEAFAGFYEAGEVLDPLTFVVTTDDPGDLPGSAPDDDDAVRCVPDTVRAGASIDVCAVGFTPGEQVQAFLHSTPQFLSVHTAAADGSLAAAVTIPSNASGTHRIELRGVTSGRSIFSDAFTISPSPSATKRLPVTGSNTRTIVVAGFASLALGAIAVAAGRSRAGRRNLA